MTLTPEAIEDRNSRAFVFFRVLFNCRLYYPIFTILFLDYGLSLEQFALLNVVWAVSIVLFDVPSGALADIVGRRRLVVFAAFLMIIEMAVLLFTPRMSALVFWLLLANRIFSGMAEACASGADEALVYDSLVGKEKEKKWSLILARTMKYQSIFMVVAMLLGAFLYDWNLISSLVPSLTHVIGRDIALRIPIAINFILAILCFIFSLEFIDEGYSHFSLSLLKSGIVDSFKKIGEVGVYISRSSTIFSLILIGLILDSAIRMFMTLISSYYRELAIPASLYGVIGAAIALVGFFGAALSSRLVSRFQVRKNFLFLAAFALLSFLGVFYFQTKWALVFVFIMSLVMFVLGFFMSHYINKAAPPQMRATVLSFKGLAFNLAYGWAGLIYAQAASKNRDSFQNTLPFFYKYFLGMLAAGLVVQFLHRRRMTIGYK